MQNPFTPVTFAEEVFDNIQTWYREKGLPVPKDEYEACQELIRYEKNEIENMRKIFESTRISDVSNSTFGTQQTQQTEQIESTPLPHIVPQTYDDPKKAFWKDYWAKKKAAGYVTKKEAAAASKKAQ